MKNKTKLLTSLWTFSTLTAIWIYAYNSIDLIDKMNEQKIVYQIEQKQLQETNEILRVEREAIDIKITENSNKWNNLNWKIQMIDETIRVIESWDLD